MAIAGKIGAVYRIDGNPSVAFTNEATNADTAKKRYTIATNLKRYWDDSAAVTVKVNGATVTTGFRIEYAGGVVEFDTAQGAAVITVSGKYFNVVQCATFFNWKLDSDLDTKDVTTFASGGWKEYLTTLKGWNASADGYWADGTYAGLIGLRLIFVLYVDSTNNKRYEGYAILKKNSITEPVDDIVKEAVELQGSGQLYYHDI